MLKIGRYGGFFQLFNILFTRCWYSTAFWAHSYQRTTGTYPLTIVGYTHFILLSGLIPFQANTGNQVMVCSVRSAHLVSTRKKTAKRSATCALKISTVPRQQRKWTVPMEPSVQREVLLPSSAKICLSIAIQKRYSIIMKQKWIEWFIISMHIQGCVPKTIFVVMIVLIFVCKSK